MKECADKKTTKIVIFCSTAFKDEAWIEIIKFFEAKGFDLQVFTSIFEDGVDQLQKIVDELGTEAKEEEAKVGGEEEKDNVSCVHNTLCVANTLNEIFFFFE